MQACEDLANFNPHLHVLAADGVFGAEGAFIALPAVPEALLAEGFRQEVLAFLEKRGGDRGRVAREDARLALALIDDPAVVRRILDHLGRWAPEPAERGPPGEAPDWPRNAVISITYHPVPDIA